MMLQKDCVLNIVKHVQCDKCGEKQVDCKFTHQQADTSIKLTCRKCSALIFDNAKDRNLTLGKNMHTVTMMMVYFVMLLG